MIWYLLFSLFDLPHFEPTANQMQYIQKCCAGQTLSPASFEFHKSYTVFLTDIRKYLCRRNRASCLHIRISFLQLCI